MTTAPSPASAPETGAARGERLEVHGVDVRFQGVVALDGVSLVAQPGQIHSVLGPNGAGKSTLFNLISGFYRPAKGEVRYAGQRISGVRPHKVARLGVARTFQNLELSLDETVLNNIQLGCHRIEARRLSRRPGGPGAVRGERESRDWALRMAHLVGLDDVLDQHCGVLPYGMRKRAEIGRALASRPGLLLLDEPVAGMTAAEVAAMRAAIKRVSQVTGLTILLIEHDVEFALGLADEVTVIDFGKVIANGSADEIRAHPKVIEAYLGVDPDGATTSTTRSAKE